MSMTEVLIKYVLPIVATISGVLLTAYKEDIARLFKRQDRRFSGIWHGEAHDIELPEEGLKYGKRLDYQIKLLKLDRRGASIKGELRLAIAASEQDPKPVTVRGVKISD